MGGRAQGAPRVYETRSRLMTVTKEGSITEYKSRRARERLCYHAYMRQDRQRQSSPQVIQDVRRECLMPCEHR